MAKGRKRRKGETFESEIRRQFGPVADRLGLTDKEITGELAFFGGVDYVLGGLTYGWNWGGRNGNMSLQILLDQDGARYSIFLHHLVTYTHPESDQMLLDNCRSWLVLQRAVASHALWVERIHPRLIAPDAPDLILASGGKKIIPALPQAAGQRSCSKTDPA